MTYAIQTYHVLNASELHFTRGVSGYNQFFYCAAYFIVPYVRLVVRLKEKINSSSKFVCISSKGKRAVHRGEQPEHRIHFVPRALRGDVLLSKEIHEKY